MRMAKSLSMNVCLFIESNKKKIALTNRRCSNPALDAQNAQHSGTPIQNALLICQAFKHRSKLTNEITNLEIK